MSISSQTTNASGRDSDSDALQAAASDQLGAQIHAVAARLHAAQVNDMVDDVAVFARKNPLLICGGAALLGFAAARVLKSGAGKQVTTDSNADPWSGHLGTAEDAA